MVGVDLNSFSVRSTLRSQQKGFTYSSAKWGESKMGDTSANCERHQRKFKVSVLRESASFDQVWYLSVDCVCERASGLDYFKKTVWE